MRGCIIKRGKKWAFVVEAGKHPVTGRRRQKWRSGFATKAEAEAELAKTLAAMGQGMKVPNPTNETVASYFVNWLTYKKQYVRPGTYSTYGWLVNYHIVPRLGSIKLGKLTPQMLLSVYEEMLEDGLAPQTVKHVHKVLHDGLETATKWGLAEMNAAKLVKAPKVPKHEMRVWNEEQLTQFFREFQNPRYYAIFFLAATTGMRRGELLALKWADIDFENAKLTVRRSYVRGYNGYVFQEPKTAAGIRNIALSPQTVAVLRKHRVWQMEDRLAAPAFEDYGLVFCQRNGKPLTPQQLEGVWRHFFKKSSLPYIRIHDLRHTHASLLLKAGVHPKVVSERLGHSSVTITLDRYSHLLPGLQEAAAAKFDELVRLPAVHQQA